MPTYTAIVTLLAIVLYGLIGQRVSVARRRYKVKVPATTGNPDFERIYRVQMNTLEWMPIFLVTLWMCAIYTSDVMAASVGLVWVIGRVMYSVGYSKAVEKRLVGFIIQSAACFVLLVGAAVGVAMKFSAG